MSWRALFFVLLGGVAFACGGGDQHEAQSASGSSSSGGGTGGSGGGPVVDKVCVKSPTPAPFAGTDACPANKPKTPDAFDDALSAGGIDRCQVRFDPADTMLSNWPDLTDDRRLPDFAPLHLGPLRLADYARETRDFLRGAASSKNPVSGTIAALSVRRGHAVAACSDLGAYAVSADDTTPLATATLALLANHHGTADEGATRAAAAKVPRTLQVKLARLVGALDWALGEVQGALGTTNFTALDYFAGAHALFVPAIHPYSLKDADVRTLETADVGRITDAAAIVAKVVEDADFGSEKDATFAPFEVKTPFGAIVVHDSSNDKYELGSTAEHALLLFDLGGDDTYEANVASSDPTHPVSIAIDVRGKDTWGYKEVPVAGDTGLLPSDGAGRNPYQPVDPMNPPANPVYGPITFSRVARQGAGLAGIGLLFDLGTEGDTYRSLAVSQGIAAVGVGVLYDAGGDDDYAAEIGSQGFAVYGIGALVDAGGKDKYASVSVSQGFGGLSGVGALIDLDGDDTYYCDPGPVGGGHYLYYSPQLPYTANNTMSQGAGQGLVSSDTSVVGYAPGGLGVLFDAKGNDHYTGAVFAQAAGYFQGIGMLVDSAGNDSYDGLWYVQSASAHVALSVFLDEDGDDTYNKNLAPAATSIGVGHDFSASLHLDLGGNDEYHAPGLSLGSGNINGIGCFVNVGGDDSYFAAGDPTFGAGNYSNEDPPGEPRQAKPTIGIFVDAGGTDVYQVAGMSRALDGTTWSYAPQPYDPMHPVTTEHGCGNDSNTKTVTIP
jgi:hypothetical protein